MKQLNTPFTKDDLKDLRAGDRVRISGYVYTARDIVHMELIKLIKKGEELPIELERACLYYVGPTPAKEGEIIGSCGPTSGHRMDAYTPEILDQGVLGLIGKGKRSQETIDSIKEHGAVYFTAIGGAAALIRSTIKEVEVVDFEEHGTEALRKLYVEDFPATVTIDSKGNNFYDIGRKEYLQAKARKNLD